MKMVFIKGDIRITIFSVDDFGGRNLRVKHFMGPEKEMIYS